MRYLIPTSQIDKFKKRVANITKVADVKVTFGESKDMVFTHLLFLGEGKPIKEKRMHNVTEVDVEDFKADWELYSFYEGGALYMVDTRYKVDYWNAQHGSEYSKCDRCGHPIKNSYVIRNYKTHEEMQVGIECCKLYGIKNANWVAAFTRELRESGGMVYGDADEEREWLGHAEDGNEAVCADDVIRGTYVKYNIRPIWQKGNGSEYARNIESYASDMYKNEHCSDKYIQDLKEYILSLQDGSEFIAEVKKICSDYYTCYNKCVFAFYAIKMYEQHLTLERTKIKAGDMLHIVGKMIDCTIKCGYYGDSYTYTIRTDSGNVCKRTGKVRYDVETSRVDFYARAKFVGNDIELDQAKYKAPKDINIIEL